MKSEIYTKSEVLHHFENLLPRDRYNKPRYINSPNFISICNTLGLIKYKHKVGYTYLKTITNEDINNVIAEIKRRNRIKNHTEVVKEDNLDVMAKKIAESGLYKIENGKVYKKTIIWKEI